MNNQEETPEWRALFEIIHQEIKPDFDKWLDEVLFAQEEPVDENNEQ